MESALLSSSIGKYQLIASLGQGGMANVYLALVAGPAGFNKLLVIKILREDVMVDAEDGVEMFLDEARLAARLVHSNIVHTYEVGEVAGRYYLAMEYLEGQSYRSVQARSRPGGIPIPDELRILSETARGLHYSHELKGYDGSALGVVHRDVSPQNVFLTYDGQVKLLDFGIAKTADAEHMTRVGVIKGKLDYIAPEQLRGDTVDRRADIFALGAMLWETMTGKRFGGGRKVGEATKAHIRLSGTERKIRDLQPDAPEALAVIVDKAIALHPDDRWADAAAFADAIDTYLAGSGHKPNAKSLSAFVSPLFEKERTKISKTIEEQIELSRRSGAVRLGDKTAVLPRMRSDGDNLSGVWPAPDSTEHTVTGTPGPRSLAPLAGPAEPQSSLSTPRPPRTGLIAVAVAAFLVLGGGSFFALAGTKNEASPSQEGSVGKGAAGAPAAAPGAGATAPASVSVTVPSTTPPTGAGVPELAAVIQIDLKVFPDEASVLLDGAPIATHFSGEFRKDTTLHLLEVSGEGYRPLKQLIPFDRDQALQIALEQLPAPAASAPRRPRSNERSERQPSPVEKQVEPPAPLPPAAVAAPAPAEAESASPTPAPGGELKVQKRRLARGLDSEDPYATP